MVVQLRPVSGLFGQRGAVAYDSSIVYGGLAVNIPALEQLEKVGEVAGAVEGRGDRGFRGCFPGHC